MKYQVLIIDNEDQEEGIIKITDLVKSKSFTTECHQFKVGLPDGRKMIDENGRIDMKLVNREFEKEFGSRRFHMILFDFNLNDPDVDGVSLIKTFNNRTSTKKAKKILYSAELEEVVQGYLDTYKNEGEFENAWDKFKTLIKLEIIDFCKKEDYEAKAVEYMPKVDIVDNDYLIDELSSHSDLKFNDSVRNYSGRTLSEIALLIQEGDSGTNNFKKEIIHMAVSLLSDLDSPK
jgi:hypothetical protein